MLIIDEQYKIEAKRFVEEQLFAVIETRPDGGLALMHAIVTAIFKDAAEFDAHSDGELVDTLLAAAKEASAPTDVHAIPEPVDPRWPTVWRGGDC